MLSVVDVVVGHGEEPPVFEGVTIGVAPGEIVGLAGPSGSGKSTLADVLALRHAPRAGQVWLDGQVASRFGIRATRADRRAVASVPQLPRQAVDPRWPLAEVIAEPLRVDGVSRAQRVRQASEIAARLGLDLDLLERRAVAASDGELQRVCFARALLTVPRYLILDEATSMLDGRSAGMLRGAVDELVHEQGVGVVVISHDESLLSSWASRIWRTTG